MLSSKIDDDLMLDHSVEGLGVALPGPVSQFDPPFKIGSWIGYCNFTHLHTASLVSERNFAMFI